MKMIKNLNSSFFQHPNLIKWIVGPETDIVKTTGNFESSKLTNTYILEAIDWVAFVSDFFAKGNSAQLYCVLVSRTQQATLFSLLATKIF